MSVNTNDHSGYPGIKADFKQEDLIAKWYCGFESINNSVIEHFHFTNDSRHTCLRLNLQGRVKEFFEYIEANGVNDKENTKNESFIQVYSVEQIKRLFQLICQNNNFLDDPSEIANRINSLKVSKGPLVARFL